MQCPPTVPGAVLTDRLRALVRDAMTLQREVQALLSVDNAGHLNDAFNDLWDVVRDLQWALDDAHDPT